MALEFFGLSLSEEVFQWPQILFYLFIPIGLFAYAIKCALGYFKLFERTPIAQWGIGAIISILTVLFIPQAVLFIPQDILGILVPAASLFAIGTFKLGGYKGVGLGFILALIYWFIVPTLIDLLTF